MPYNNPNEWYLIVTLMALNGQFRDTVYSIDEDKSFTFGRSADCTLAVPDDETVSPLHFQIIVEPPVVWLKDCLSISGVFLKHYLLRWHHLGGLPTEANADRNAYRNTAVLCDNDFIRVGDYKFLLRIDMPDVCICCGNPLYSVQRALSIYVGDIYYCPICRFPDENHCDNCDEFCDYITSIEEYFESKKYYDRKLLLDYFNGHIVRQAWLRGIFNSNEFIEPSPDCRVLLAESKIAFYKIFGKQFLPEASNKEDQ